MIKSNKENHCARNASFKNWNCRVERYEAFAPPGVAIGQNSNQPASSIGASMVNFDIG
jgi:hypothetical protein